VSPELLPELRAGAETWGGIDVEAPGDLAVAAGPALSWTPTPTLWTAVTVGFGIEHVDRFSVRAVIGLRL
jgi:hypothetical protein